MEKNNLQDCGGCSDDRSEGTHAMHTKQHPCPEGGDPNCGYCFPEKNNAEIERIVREFESKLHLSFGLGGFLTTDYSGENTEVPIWDMDEDTAKKWLRDTLTTFKAHIEAALLEEIATKVEAGKDTDRINSGSEARYREGLGFNSAKDEDLAIITTRKEQIGK